MSDVARQRGTSIDVPALSQRLGIPIVTTEAHRRVGIEAVRQALLDAAESKRPAPKPVFPAAFYAAVDEVARDLRPVNGEALPRYLVERLLLDPNGQIEKWLTPTQPAGFTERVAQIRDRLAKDGFRLPAAEARTRYAAIREVVSGVLTHAAQPATTTSDRIDRVLTHRVSGLLVFAGIMFVVFQSIYYWAEPFMRSIEWTEGLIKGGVESLIGPGALRSLVVDGVVAGVGGVLVFLPQIVFLFLFIAVLEDCGYMARAAFLMDRLMSRLGLSGKSFIPLMSSFACAIPGVMATRVIENRRDRMVTILIAPLMSCSARLPVYLLLIWAFVPAVTYLGGWVSLQGLVLFAMSSLGAIVAVPCAWLLKKTFFRGETPPFVMELPSYKLPSPRVVLHRAYDRGKAFVTRAGTLIFATSIVVWAAGYFPANHSERDTIVRQIEAMPAVSQEDAAQQAELDKLRERRDKLGSQLIEKSFLGHLGHAIEPAVRPLGWDWRIGVGAIASFPAREVIIATLGTIYSLGNEVDKDNNQGLITSLQNATDSEGRKVYSLPVALSIMVFFALCAQCAGTLMTIKRETNRWIWPVFTFVYMTSLAYVGALITYQVARLF
jgi:ferrous iron transport protein B